MENKEYRDHILRCFKTGTVFQCNGKGSIMLNKSITKSTNFDRFSELVANGVIDLDCAFVAEAVHTLGFCTKYMVQQFLAVQRAKFPQKKIPDFTRLQLENKMKWMCSKGMLMAYEYVYTTESGKAVIDLFCCTPYGHKMFRSMLNIGFCRFDENSIMLPQTECFKKISAGNVALNFVYEEGCTGIYFNGRYGMEQYSSLPGYVYAAAEFDKKIYMVEPMYFLPDTNIQTEEELYQKNTERMATVISLIGKFKEDYDKDVTVVFVLESIDGLRKLNTLLDQMELPESMRNSLYTTERCFTSENVQLAKCFLYRKPLDEGKHEFVPIGEEWRN